MSRPRDIERLSLPEPARDIFRRACRILDECLTPHTPGGEGWRIGGGTILAARWRHRNSRDIDLLVHPHTETALLQPEVNPEIARLLGEAGAERSSFGRLSEIYFRTGRIEILAAQPTPRVGHHRAVVEGYPATTLASSQILTAKMLNRSLRAPVRDLYDFAVARRTDPRALAIAVNSLTQMEISTRLLRWEMRKDQYTKDARAAMENVPERYRQVQEEPVNHAIRAVRAVIYGRVRIHADKGRVTVHRESVLDPPDETYDTVEDLRAGFERDGVNALSSASGFNPDSVRGRAIEAMQGNRTVTVLELRADRHSTAQP